MKIEKVENGFIVEIELTPPSPLTASTTIAFGMEKHICTDLEKLLSFIGSHYTKGRFDDRDE